MLRNISRIARRGLFNARAALGRSELPAVRNEPFLDYAPGSKERAALKVALEKLRKTEHEIPLFINGKEIRTDAQGVQVMPSDHQQVVARYSKANAKLVKESIDGSLKAKKHWECMPFEDRMAVFLKAADLMATKYRAEQAAAMMLGSGKTVWQAEIDSIVESVDFLRFNCYYAQQMYAVQPPMNSPYVWNRTEYRPLEGYVLAISPFNFSAIGTNLASQPAMLGNVVQWKPASTSVLANWVTYKILMEAGLPDGVINWLPGQGSEIGPALITDPNLAAVHFTGSSETFNSIWQQVAGNMDNYKTYVRMVGETGGKNFHFLHKSVGPEMDNAVAQTIRGAFEYQGQKCSATSRVYCPDTLWPQFKEKLLTAVAGMKVGQPDDMSTFMTAVIDKPAHQTIVDYIEAAKAEGGEVLCGGKWNTERGFFVEPTVILTKDPKSITMREEIFGPVLTVYVYDADKYEETLEICDQTSEYGLTGSLFATDRYALEYGYNALRHSAGNFYVNDKSTGAIVGQQPFGGARKSGTNDKAGSALCLQRWVSPRTIKENLCPITEWRYPHMA